MSRFATRLRTFVFALAFNLVLTVPIVAAGPQGAEKAEQDKNLDIRSSLGDLHMGKDADARGAGLPFYPGARPRFDEKDSDVLNFGVLTEAFGMKLVVAKYETDDAPSKVVNFYREKLKKYGNVLECHTTEHGGNVNGDVNDQKKPRSKELKCEGDSIGPVTELKVGTEDNQHVVAVEPSGTGKGASFALVFVYTRTKQGEI
jgi:hypothetical protein